MADKDPRRAEPGPTVGSAGVDTTRYFPTWRVALAAPTLSSKRHHERAVLTEPLAYELHSPNSDGVSYAGACLSEPSQQTSRALAGSLR